MADEKRNINGYEVINAVQLGGGEVILAENKSAELRYMVCDCSWANPFGVNEYFNGVGSADFLEMMSEFTRRISERISILESERDRRGLPPETLTAADCEPKGMDAELEGRVVVIKADSLAPEYRTADHQLALCTGGFGASPNARGRTVYCKNLFTGEDEKWQRANITGTVAEDRLPDWAKERLSVIRQAEKKEPAAAVEPLSKDKFWQMIDEARETSGFWQDMNNPLAEALAKCEEPDIVRFKQIYDEYHSLANKDKLWAAAAVILGGCSDDGFSDFRAWLIAQSKEVYMNALTDPDSLAGLETLHDFNVERSASRFTPPDGYFYAPEFEGFAYTANNAYKEKLGGDADVYDVINAPLLSKQEKRDILSEITYAADIDAKWSGRGVSADETEAILKKLCPNLYGMFREPTVQKVAGKPVEKESVLDQIKQSRQISAAEHQSKNTTKKHKGAPEL